MPKAYKILALRENISNREAKQMLDLGLVYSNDKKLRASDEVSERIPLKIIRLEEPSILYQDSKILAINKPNMLDITMLEKRFSDYSLLHRLDKPTSGVILLGKKDSEFYNLALEKFKNKEVYKEYLALVSGIVAEKMVINKPISTTKNHYAKSRIDLKHGKSAISEIEPLKLIGKNTLLKVVIKTGRTHQIRIHLSSINHPILGDSIYGGRAYKRLMLHSYKISLLDYTFCADKGNFWKYLAE